jgi:Fe-S cluster assembly iron-binding protein IscA
MCPQAEHLLLEGNDRLIRAPYIADLHGSRQLDREGQEDLTLRVSVRAGACNNRAENGAIENSQASEVSA